MPLNKIQFKSGIISDTTPYTNEGGFVDGDKIRFRLGSPEKIGGWVKYSANTYLGTARRLHNWIALDGSDFLGVGTHLKYYIEEGQTFNDITPIRETTSAGDVTFSATNGSTTITVTDAAHGANENDFVTFSGAASLGGTITATILNAEFQITSLISSNAYTITSSVAANSSDTNNGGGSVVGTYQLNVGLDNTVGGTGWGAGQWSGTTSGALATQLAEALDDSETAIDVDSATGITAGDLILIEEELITVGTISSNTLGTGGGPSTRGASGTTAATHADNTLVRLAVGNADSANDFVGWGNAASVTVSGAQIRTWSHDNFGEDLIINPRDGGLFYWDKTNGLSTRAVELSTRAGTKTSVPTKAKQIIVSDLDRHLIAFGCDGLGATSSATQGDGTQDPLLIRFSSQENPLDFFPTSTNTAGDLRIGGGSEFVQAVETKEQILVFTNKTLHAMKFIGPPFTFGLKELSVNITIMSPASAIAVDDNVYWMGVDTFYVYSGQTQQLPCTVKDKVFLDLNIEERDKVHAGVNTEFSEIVWYYPSAGSQEIDKYVIYNYTTKEWSIGSLSRQVWIDDQDWLTYPTAVDSSGTVFYHENGNSDNGSDMTSYVECGAIEITDGARMLLLDKFIPDVDGSPQVTVFTKKYNNSSEVTKGPFDLSSSVEKVSMRAKGRQIRFKVSNTSRDYWRFGNSRFQVTVDGTR